MIWDGDILVAYAETGLFLYLFRRLKPRTLIILGLSAMLILVPMIVGVGAAVNFMKAATVRVEAKIKQNQKPTWLDQKAHDFWTRNLEKEFKRDPATLAKKWAEDLAIHRGNYLGIVKNRAPNLLMGQTIGFLLGGGLFAASRMLVGMGLMKLGVFSGATVAALLPVVGCPGLRNRPSPHGLRRDQAHSQRVLVRLSYHAWWNLL